MLFIQDRPVSFDGDVMVVQFTSKERHMNAPKLENVPGKHGYYTYRLTYSPQEKSLVNGVAPAAMNQDDVQFIINLLGGVKLANVYAQMRREWNTRQVNRPQRREFGTCTCGHCFDCIAQ